MSAHRPRSRDSRGSGGAPGRDARLFRMLLGLYPPAFRDVYGEEMTAYFLARLARARARRGRTGVAALWLKSAADVAWTALSERRGEHARRQHTTRNGGRMSIVRGDLAFAMRRLRQTPLFTISAIGILALAIGLNTTVFSVVDALLLRPPPFGDPESIVHIYQDSDDGEPNSTSYPAYRDMAAMTDVFAAVGAISPDYATWETAEGAQQASIEYATASYLTVLGLEPQRGRWFSAEHDEVGAAMVAVVSDRTWRTRMGADPDVLGRTIRLNNQPVTIVGIGPTTYNGEAGALVTDFWLSISSVGVGGPFRVSNLERREDHWYLVKARLAPGATVDRARAAMTGLAERLAEAFPALNRGRDITVFAHDEVRFHPDADGSLRTASVGLFTVAALVLLLACGNLGNLLLVRGIGRRSEVAVRLALGAGRARVMSLLLLEALLLAGAGAAVGLVVAAWSLRLIPRLPLPVPGGGLDAGIDARVVTFSVLLALATGLLFGLLPALRTARADLAASLRDEGRGRTMARSVSMLRGGLLTLQVAVSLVLVVGAGLFARSLANMQRVDPGFDVERLAVIGTNPQQGGVDGAEVALVAARILEQVEALPGVERAAITSRLPVQGGGTTTQVVDGYVPSAGTGSVELNYTMVSRDYFATMGIPLLAGRGFAPEDRPESPRVIVVNETAARIFWGGDALGGRIRSESATDGWREVVGVVADSRVVSLDEAPTPMIYYSADQTGLGSFSVVARTTGDPATLLGPLRGVLRQVRSTLPVTRLLTLDAHLGDAMAGARALAALLGAFSLLALLLAALGVYAVVSFSVEQRAPELGIRSALGAAGPRLVRMVIGEVLVIVAVGVVAGLGFALIAGRGLESLLFGVGSFDPLTFAGAATLLLLAAGAAAFLPALRAARADPVEVLRRA